MTDSIPARATVDARPGSAEMLARSDMLERELDAVHEGTAATERVRELVADLAASGADTWDAGQRAALRAAVTRWTSFLRRQGVPADVPDLAAFAGQLPSVDPIEQEELIERAKRDQPIVARRVDGAQLRELDGQPNVRIVDCVVSSSDFGGVHLPDARFLHTTFAGCDFDSARLPDLVATSSIFREGTLSAVDAPGATFCGSRLDSTSMRGADFAGASFAASTVRNVDAREAKLSDVLFDLATLEEVRLDGAELQRAIFTGAAVRGLSFARADLSQAIFSGADVHGSSFEGAVVDGASFTKAADVAFASFDPSSVDVAEFSDLDARRLAGANGSP